MQFTQVAACLCFATLLGSSGVAQNPVSFQRTFYHDGVPANMQFSAWMPPGLDRVRGVVLSIPGSGGDTNNITTNVSWRGKLTGMGFAIIGLRDVGDSGLFYWGTSAPEISSNMQTMITAMADSLGRPEINNAPLIIEGVSKGGFATNDIVQTIPERVLGFVEDKGSTYLWADPSKYNAIKKVPGLLVLAETDNAVPPPAVYLSFSDYRSLQGQVAEEVDWTGHQNTHPDTRFAFIDQIYRLRYPHGQLPSLTPGNPLAPVDIPLSNGWVGEVNQTNFFPPFVNSIEWPSITTNDDYQYVFGYEERSWLPDKAMALVYRAHNAIPAGIGKDALVVSIANAKDRNVNGGAPIDVKISLSGVSYTGIDVYHEDQLIAHLDYSPSDQHVFYTPTETGIHTFVAVASYPYNGQTHFTSKYTTVGVANLSKSYMGDFNNDGIVDAADYSVWRDSVGQTGIALAADGTGALGPPDGVVDLLDFNLWKSHFGTNTGAGGHVAGLPEPSTIALLISGAIAVFARFRAT